MTSPAWWLKGRIVAEALEIARDVARKLIEARCERESAPNLPTYQRTAGVHDVSD